MPFNFLVASLGICSLTCSSYPTSLAKIQQHYKSTPKYQHRLTSRIWRKFLLNIPPTIPMTNLCAVCQRNVDLIIQQVLISPRLTIKSEVYPCCMGKHDIQYIMFMWIWKYFVCISKQDIGDCVCSLTTSARYMHKFMRRANASSSHHTECSAYKSIYEKTRLLYKKYVESHQSQPPYVAPISLLAETQSCGVFYEAHYTASTLPNKSTIPPTLCNLGQCTSWH